MGLLQDIRNFFRVKKITKKIKRRESGEDSSNYYYDRKESENLRRPKHRDR